RRSPHGERGLKRKQSFLDTKTGVVGPRTGNGDRSYELDGLQFDASKEAMFLKNQTVLRVIEGYDVVGTDKGAYAYALLKAPTPKP
ncbi:MAG: hypothetical protein RSB55_09610, partial [Oscillospiraceae bacterium]